MDAFKGSGKHVDAAIDKAATVVKAKVGGLIGEAKHEEKGIADKVTGVVKDIGAHAAVDSAADKALSFGKGLAKGK